MPKNEVSDPITDQEMAFALLVLSGAMTDRRAAEAVGLHPDSAASTKAKPSVHAYMLGHRAAVQQQLLQQDADLSPHAAGRAVEEQRPLSPNREQVLARLWELAYLSPEMTRNSITGQIKAISIIVAMQSFIPDRRAVSSEKKSAPAPVKAEIYKSAWLREQEASASNPQPTPAPNQEEAQQEEASGVSEPGLAPGSPAVAPSNPGPSQPAFAPRVPLAENLPPYVPQVTFAPDTRVPHSIKKNPFARFR